MVTNKFKKRLLLVFISLTLLILIFGTNVFLPKQSDIKGIKTQSVITSESQNKLTIGLNEKNNLMEFRDQGVIQISFPIKKLDLDRYLPIKEEDKKLDSIYAAFLMKDDNQVFFSVSRTMYCGANNCHWGIYVYQLAGRAGKADLLAKDVFGNVEQILLSPDKSRVAILSYVHGGHCNNGNYLYLVDRVSKKTLKIDSLNLSDYYDSEVKQLNWEGSQDFTATVLNFCSPTGEKGIKRQVKCSISSDFNQDWANCKET